MKRQPAPQNWSAIEENIGGSYLGDQLAKGFAVVGLLLFLYVGFDYYQSLQSSKSQLATIDEMIDYELTKEAYELESLHENYVAENNLPIAVEKTPDVVTINIEEPRSVTATTVEKSDVMSVTGNYIDSYKNDLTLTDQPSSGITSAVGTPSLPQEADSHGKVSNQIRIDLTESSNMLKNEIQQIEPGNNNVINMELSKLDLIDASHIDNFLSNETALEDRKIEFALETYNTGFYTGTLGSGHNSWILNNRAEEASNAENLDYKLDFGVAYGLIAGYDFSKHWSLEAEWVINSKQGQKYENNYQTTGIVSEEEVDLNYMHFPLLVKYKNSRYSDLFNAQRSLNVLFGPQYSVIQESTTTFNNGLVVIEELVNKKEFGVALGIEYNVLVKQNLDIGLGARSSIGTDINMFPKPFSTDLDKTNNLLFGLNAAVRYYPFKQ